LRRMAANHDIIVLYVRPDGFRSFDIAYQQARGASASLCYEPLPAGENLSYLKQ